MILAILFSMIASAETQPELSKLPLTLIGTIVRAEPAKSLGTIRFNSNQQTQTYFAKDKVGTVAIVQKYEREKVILTNTQTKKTEYLRIPSFNPARAIGKDTFKDFGSGNKEVEMKRTEVDKVIKDPGKFLQDAASEQVMENGKIVGFKIFNIKPGSAYTQLGLQDGDVIQSVNGEPIDGIQKALEIYNQLKDSSMIRLKIGRNSKAMEITYYIR